VQGSFEGDVHVLEFGGAVTRRTARLHDAPVNVVALTPDGRTGVSGSLGRLKVWDLGSFTEIRRAHGFGDKLRTLAVSTDCRRVVSGAKDGAIRIWDLEALPTPVATLRGHEGPANTVAVTPEGRWVLSGGEDATLRFWDVARKREVARFTADDGITACAIVSTNPWTFACGEGTGRLHILRLAGEPPATR
jgi:WD40 repeat protein